MYKLKNEYNLNGEIEYFGENRDKTCRFCGKMKPEVEFQKKAHAVSDFLGNKSLFSYYECDTCNELFAKYETNLANALLFYRGVSGSYKKKGKVNLSRTIKSRLDKNTKKMDIFVKDFNNGKDGVNLVFEENNVYFKIKKKINYFLCYKTFVKFAVSILPASDVSKCQKYIDLLEEEKYFEADSFNYCYFTNVFKTPINNPKARIYEKVKNTSSLPSFLFSFDYEYYQFFIFFVLEGEEMPKRISEIFDQDTNQNIYSIGIQDCFDNLAKDYYFITKVTGEKIAIALKNPGF